MDVVETVKAKLKELNDGPAGDALNSAKTSIAHGLDGAGRFIDEKTHGKYASVIHTSVDKAKEFLGQDHEESGQDGEDGQGAQGGQDSQGGQSGQEPGGDASAPESTPGDDRPES